MTCDGQAGAMERRGAGGERAVCDMTGGTSAHTRLAAAVGQEAAEDAVTAALGCDGVKGVVNGRAELVRREHELLRVPDAGLHACVHREQPPEKAEAEATGERGAKE